MSAGRSSLTTWLQTLLAALIVIALVYGWSSMGGPNAPLHNDTDDAMRMVTAENLLNGQPWQDTSVARDNTPFGGNLHWSRLVDAPIAGLIALFGANGAAIIWPLLLIVPLVALTRLVVGRLVPTAGLGTVAALVALTLPLYTEFVPGRVDHHNAQIVLLQALLAALLLGRRNFWGGLLAGVIAATCFAIGLEIMVIVIGAAAGLAIAWLAAPQEHKRGLVGFAIGLGGAALAYFVIATPPANYFVAACDALSIVYVVALVLGGIALAASALVASHLNVAARAAILLGLGIAAAIITAVLFPACLAGPYAGIDPRLGAYFASIVEAIPLWRLGERAAFDSVLFIGTALLALSIVVSLAMSAFLAARRRGEAQRDWLIVFLMLAAAFAMMALQLRGSRLTGALAIPAYAWLIASIRAHWRPVLLQAFGLLVAWLLAASFAQFIFAALVAGGPSTAAPVTPGPSVAECRRESAYTQLAALPVGRVAVPISIASHVLRYTPHSVLSAGFHRNGQSVVDSLDFFAGNESRAQEIVAERGLTYVVTCGVDDAIDSWSWLTPLPSSGPLRLYAVAP